MADNFLKDRSIAVIAYGELEIQRRSEATPGEFAAELMEQLLEKTGLSHRDIDGVAVNFPTAEAGNTFYTNMLVDALGLQPRWLQLTDIGGCVPLGNLARAAAALTTGMCDMVMCIQTDCTGAAALSTPSR